LGVGMLLSVGSVAFRNQNLTEVPVFKEGEPVGKEGK